MLEIFTNNPWLMVIALGVLVPITGIVFGTLTRYLQKSRQAELDAALKQEMLQRGMSADEIVQVLQASSSRALPRGCARSGPVRGSTPGDG